MKIKHVKNDRYHLNMLQTSKFKTTRIQISFANDLHNETATKRALLPYLLKAVSKKYPTRQELISYLEDMYAANLSAGVKKIGLTQFLVFDMQMINDKYTLNNEDLFKEALNFLYEVIFNPLFLESVFQEEKRLLDEFYKSVYANKMRYSIKKMLDTMFKDDPYSTPTLGDEESLQKLSLQDMTEVHQNMLNNDQITINVVGDIDFEEIEKLISEKLTFKNRSKELSLIDYTNYSQKSLTELFESQDVNQGKLAIGYQFPVYYQTEDYYKAIVFNTLLGGGPESLLFKVIREELSLVYFIGSSYDYYKGFLSIYSGINQQDYEKTIIAIDEIVERIKRNDYSDKALLIAQKTITNSLIESLDSQSNLTARINNLSLFNKELDIAALIAKINKVTKEDISEIAQKLHKDTLFFLRNDELE